MTETLRLGSFAGVRIGVNWTVLFIFLLIVFGLAGGRFPLLYPDQPGAVYVVAGLVAGVVFFLSLLAHEVSHAVVAMRNGLTVDGITLWLFGGVAKLDGEADDPGADFRIAGVGPLVSLILAAAFWGVALLMDLADLPAIAVGVVTWLALINFVLAIFNLVPAAPLDGGRVLRAALWRLRGDRVSAAVTAARGGRLFGFLLVGLGLLEFVLGAGFGGLWLVLIGWFLVNAAGAEEQYAKVRGALADIRVSDVMSADPVVVPDTLDVDSFLDQYVFRTRFSTFPLVSGDGRPAGLVTLNRVKQVDRADRRRTRLGEIACPVEDVPVAAPQDWLADVVPKMAGCADGRALVIDGDRIVGILSPVDVTRTMEVAQLRGERHAA